MLKTFPQKKQPTKKKLQELGCGFKNGKINLNKDDGVSKFNPSIFVNLDRSVLDQIKNINDLFGDE